MDNKMFILLVICVQSFFRVFSCRWELHSSGLSRSE